MLEGTVGPNGKCVKAVGAAQLKILRAAREEVNYYKRHHNKVLDHIFPALWRLTPTVELLTGQGVLRKRMLSTRQVRRVLFKP